MNRDRAAYMREYRKRKQLAQAINEYPALADTALRIAALEEEVAHLKHLLHQRSVLGTYSTRPFTPVPKKR